MGLIHFGFLFVFFNSIKRENSIYSKYKAHSNTHANYTANINGDNNNSNILITILFHHSLVPNLKSKQAPPSTLETWDSRLASHLESTKAEAREFKRAKNWRCQLSKGLPLINIDIIDIDIINVALTATRNEFSQLGYSLMKFFVSFHSKVASMDPSVWIWDQLAGPQMAGRDFNLILAFFVGFFSCCWRCCCCYYYYYCPYFAVCRYKTKSITKPTNWLQSIQIRQSWLLDNPTNSPDWPNISIMSKQSIIRKLFQRGWYKSE